MNLVCSLPQRTQCSPTASELEDQQISMVSMGGSSDQALVNRKWVHKRPYTSIPSKENLTAGAYYTTMSPPLPPPASTSPWQSRVGLQTTQPRPVFSPHSSYRRHLPDSTCEGYPPPPNSDLSMASMNLRDQNSMTTPLKDSFDDHLPPPPPLVNGARLGFIIVL